MSEKIPAESDQTVFIAKSKAIVRTQKFERPAYIVREVSRDNVKVLSVEDGILSFDTPRMVTAPLLPR